MSTTLGLRRTIVLGPDVAADAGFDVSTTGDKAFYTPGQPVDIVRWGVIADDLVDVGAGMTIKADHRPTVGSDTDRTDGTVGDITVTADIAAGKGAYTESFSGSDGSTTTINSTGVGGQKREEAGQYGFEVDPGEQVVFQVTDAADTAGKVYIFIEVIEKPFVGGSESETGSRIANMTSND